MRTEEDYLEEIKTTILAAVDLSSYAVFLFGGRARGRSGKAVDVDVGILGKAPFPLNVLAKLCDTIEESSVPLKVDIVDFFSVDPQFRKIAMRDVVIWSKPSTLKIN